jgi:hypothetical protein
MADLLISSSQKEIEKFLITAIVTGNVIFILCSVAYWI